MITQEIREEIKRIQSELKQPFPASAHQFREIPGSSKKWVFISWQLVRDRLDSVHPDWIIDYSEVQYLNNDAICRCSITILGVRKEAIASVPVSIISNKGNEMTRGSAPDRLMAEGIKNAGEQWGVGRYLDNQSFAIRYLWDRMKELDDEKAGEVRRLSEQYKIQVGARIESGPKPKETGFLSAVAGTPSTISEGQQKRLWAITKSEKLTDEQVKAIQKRFGFESTKDILSSKYEQVIEALKKTETVPLSRLEKTGLPLQPTEDLFPANNLVVKQIRTVTGHNANWIYAQCRHYGCDRPGMMDLDKLGKLIADMCADWAVSSKAIEEREHAHTSIESALNFATSAGQSFTQTALNWIARHQTTLVSQ